MELIPFEQIKNIPDGRGAFVDVFSSFEFIDVADTFILKTVRGIRKPYYKGLIGFMFDGQLKFSFHKNYKIESIEFREPYKFLEPETLNFQGIDLFLPTLVEIQSKLDANNIGTKILDVGLEAPEIGVSFYSHDYEKDLNVPLDAVTVHF